MLIREKFAQVKVKSLRNRGKFMREKMNVARKMENFASVKADFACKQEKSAQVLMVLLSKSSMCAQGKINVTCKRENFAGVKVDFACKLGKSARGRINVVRK